MKKCLFLCLSLLLVPALALCEHRAVLFTATDLHYIAPTLTDNGAFFTDLIERGDGKAMAYSDAPITQAERDGVKILLDETERLLYDEQSALMQLKLRYRYLLR